MNRRVTGATLAMLLALGVPAAAVQAAELPPVQTVSAPAPPNPAPLPAPTITSSQAEAALKEFFTLPQRSEQVELQWNLSRLGPKRTWDLRLTVRDANGATGFPLASVDAITGRVLRYGSYGMLPGPVRTGPLGPVRTEDEARARAWSLVQKLAPEKADVLKEAPVGVPGYVQRFSGSGVAVAGDVYDFTWVEYHDGVPFPGSRVSVGVKKQTLDYAFAYVSLDDSMKFQAGPAKVSAEEALKLWQAQANPTLAYQPILSSSPYGPAKTTGYRLVYTVGNVGRAIDATTGTWARDFGPYPPAETDTKPAEPEAVPAGSVTPLVPQALPLSDAAAQKLALAILEAPEGTELQTGNTSSSQEKLLHYSFWGQGSYGTIEFEPKTGLIRSASKHTAPSWLPFGQSKTVTPEQEAQAKQAAFAVVQTYYSQLRDQVRLVAQPSTFGPQDNQFRRFRFVRYVNDVAVPAETITTSIDLSTMTWVEMGARWTTGVTFPSPAGAISSEQARETVLADRKPTLIYRPVYPPVTQDQLRKGPLPRPTEAALAYVLTPPATPQVDALTGHPVGALSDLQAAYKQVTGHWAEGELQFMLARGIVRPDQFNPDAALTRAQAVALLLNRTQQHSGRRPSVPAELPYTDLPETDPAYGTVGMAWVEGWLRPLGDEQTFRPGAPVTRAEFAVWAVRAMGLGDLARSGLTVQAEYNDLGALTAEQRNAVSFLRALGLLAPADTFRGAEPLTQAAGAALTVRIYNYLLTR